MTQDYSTALMYPSRWSARLVLTPSSLKLDLRPATAWSLTHSSHRLTVHLMLKHLPLHVISTTVVYRLLTMMDRQNQAFQPEIAAQQADDSHERDQEKADDSHEKQLQMMKMQPKPSSNNK